MKIINRFRKIFWAQNLDFYLLMPAPIYQDALYNLIPIGNNEYISIMTWIMQQIKASKYGFIKLDASDLKNAFGPEFLEKKDEAIYESLRNIMRKYKIKVRCKKKENGGLIIILENKIKNNITLYRIKKNATLENKIELLEKNNAILKNRIESLAKNNTILKDKIETISGFRKIEIVDKEDTMFCR